MKDGRETIIRDRVIFGGHGKTIFARGEEGRCGRGIQLIAEFYKRWSVCVF